MFVKNISVISPKLELVSSSCTILFPKYWSPLCVSSSSTMWSVSFVSGVFASGPIAPFTTETNPAALTPSVPVFVKTKLSPTEYPEPALSIIISDTPPDPISSIAILAPTPPPVIDNKSVVEITNEIKQVLL